MTNRTTQRDSKILQGWVGGACQVMADGKTKTEPYTSHMTPYTCTQAMCQKNVFHFIVPQPAENRTSQNLKFVNFFYDFNKSLKSYLAFFPVEQLKHKVDNQFLAQICWCGSEPGI